MSRIPFYIAVIDDEAQVRRALLRLIQAEGMRVRTYESACEFLSQWRSDPPDCIVLDLQMPNLNGFELMQCLRQLGAQLPFIFITAHDESVTRERCMAIGAQAYLRKPLDGQTLLQAIDQACQRDRYG